MELQEHKLKYQSPRFKSCLCHLLLRPFVRYSPPFGPRFLINAKAIKPPSFSIVIGINDVSRFPGTEQMISILLSYKLK